MPTDLIATEKAEAQRDAMQLRLDEGKDVTPLQEVICILDEEYILVDTTNPTETQVANAIVGADFNNTGERRAPDDEEKLRGAARAAFRAGYIKTRTFKWS